MAASQTAANARPAVPEVVVSGGVQRPQGWLAWLTTADHKRIGVMYLVATFVFFLLGGTEALLMRLQLGGPDNTLLSPERYNAIMTMHGSTMVFLFVVPVWAGFSNYIVPLMIGARDMAFPRLLDRADPVGDADRRSALDRGCGDDAADRQTLRHVLL